MGTRGIQQGCKRNARQLYRDPVGMLRRMQYHSNWGCNRQCNMAAMGMQCSSSRGNATGSARGGIQQGARGDMTGVQGGTVRNAMQLQQGCNRAGRGYAKETQQGYKEDAMRLQKLCDGVAMGMQQG